MPQTHTIQSVGGPLSGNITVGQGLACRFRIFLYDAKRMLIPGPLPNGCHADGLVVDDAVPEYVIAQAVFARHKEFWVSHEYTFAGMGPGDFVAVVTFDQQGGTVSPRSEHISAHHPGSGQIYQHVKFVQT